MFIAPYVNAFMFAADSTFRFAVDADIATWLRVANDMWMFC